jgi:UDP-galactopyranose mutase
MLGVPSVPGMCAGAGWFATRRLPFVPAALPDLVCFSHLRWDHVFQRPHHLMSRAARTRRVFFVEEPVEASARGVAVKDRGAVTVVTPQVPAGLRAAVREPLVEALLLDFLAAQRVRRPIAWLYTPMAVPVVRRLDAAVVVYDCMDELSAFNEASPRLPALERELLGLADVVFTGGDSLWRAKRRSHPDVHAFPSAVDAAHFAQARRAPSDPEDQAGIPRPRLGWFGVIDERLDLDLLAGVARRRPDWSIVLVGPVAKIPVSAIPAEPNVHWLGQKPYEGLPAYLAGWDVAIMPFARNAATAYISPTKTPEYLAGGRPVVSTAIADVVRPYGVRGLVRIADDPDQFVAACEAAMAEDAATRVAAADAFLAGISWDRTWAAMERHLERAMTSRPARVAGRGVPADLPGIGVGAGRGTS